MRDTMFARASDIWIDTIGNRSFFMITLPDVCDPRIAKPLYLALTDLKKETGFLELEMVGTSDKGVIMRSIRAHIGDADNLPEGAVILSLTGRPWD